jgi:Bacterial protein of unknown function (DUF916)
MPRRWLTAAAVALAVATSAATVAAGPARPAAAATPTASATPDTGQFGLVPASGANGAARGYFQLSADPGGSVTDIIVIGNPSAQTQRLRLGLTDGLTASNSGSAYGPLENKCAAIACWVIGVPKTVTLAPHSRAAVRFEVKVPEGTKPAQYLTGIAATLAQTPKPTPVASNAHGSAQVIVIPRVVIGVAVTVGQLDQLQVRTAITGVTAGYVDGLVRLTVQVKNTGQRFTKGTGKMSCSNGGVTRSYPVSMDTVLPGQGAGLQVNGTGMHEGTWQCTAKVKEVGGGTATWTGAVTVASTQPAATKRVGNNAYVVPGGGGIPAWAIALMVLGALILFSLWALLLRRQRTRNLRPPAP